ncbi:MAG TPA: transcriptional regulator GutM [Actinomycetales bacterium]|nr:transcriptional regulator GutM [Actinomycetales bacterium]
MNPAYLLVAVVAGWMVQAFFTYRQSQAFRRAAYSLRDVGTVSVGVGGRRYRGGRAFVAVAFDDTGRARGALVLRGFTTFARPVPLTTVQGMRAGRLAGDDDVDGLRANERDACRQAAQLWRQSRKRSTSTTAATPRGRELTRRSPAGSPSSAPSGGSV